MDNDADQEQTVPPVETPQESQRNLASVLLADLNVVATATVSAVTSAYGVKKVMGRGPDDKGGSDGGPEPDPPP